MRKFKTIDVFKMSKILKKIDLLDKVKYLFTEIKKDMTEAEKEQLQQEKGIEFFYYLFENMHKAEHEIADFFSGLIGKSEEEFLEMPIDELMAVIQEFIKQDGLQNFLSLAAGLKK